MSFSVLLSFGLSSLIVSVTALSAIKEKNNSHQSHWAGITEQSPWENDPTEVNPVVAEQVERSLREGTYAPLPTPSRTPESAALPGGWGGCLPVEEAVEPTSGQPVEQEPSDWVETVLAFAPMTMDPGEKDYPLTVETLKDAARYGKTQNWVTQKLLGTTKSTSAYEQARALYQQIQRTVSLGAA
jgi:hypothetical protein